MRIRKISSSSFAILLLITAIMCGVCFGDRIKLNDLSAWRGSTGDWLIAGDAVLNPANARQLAPKPGKGVMINGPTGRTSNILTTEEFGDVKLHIEFTVPKGSNSGVYLQGRYEIQVFDSWQVEKPQHSDCGGIYQRWKNNRGYEGRPPMVNASKAPGQWQTFDAIFLAPRFDSKGNKISNARFVNVRHNGLLVHEGVEVTGPTRAPTYNDEKPVGPIMLQGDHGPVAYRNIQITPITVKTRKPGPIKALIVDGQNNHNWKGTTPVLKRLLEDTGLFVVDVATTPSRGQPMDKFRPNFISYSVIVANYTGDEWPASTKSYFEKYMSKGGGLVVFHAADNAFVKWDAWNEMIAVGGWSGRNEKSGPMIRYRDGQMVLDYSPGRGGSHGPQHEFQIVTRNADHPITAGLPEKWMHASDELYSTLRGPAKNVTLLATAFADKAKRGSGENEPILFTISYGQGRIFHTVLGHDTGQLKSVGFIETFTRGAEWAATGKVTQAVPDDFPTATKVSLRTKNNAKLPAGYGGEIVTWDFGKDRQALAAIEEDIRTSLPGRVAAIEKAIVKAMTNPKCTYAGKQFVCRMLRRMGTAESVPALAAMLSDKEVSHMARFALQDMPAPEAGDALVKALGELKGDLKIGIVGSLGLRGEQRAATQIAELMKSKNKMMAQAAIKALSHFWNREAGMALVNTELPEDLEILRQDAILMCTDTMLAKGNTEFAAGIYKRMTAPENDTFIRIAAYRGLVRAEKANAVPTVIELLKDADVDLQRAAGKFIVEMPGTEATKAFARQLGSLPAATQIILISALESRNDKAAASAITAIAKTSANEAVRVAAIGALATLGDATSVQMLAALSVKKTPAGKEAIKSLTRLSGDGVSDALIKTAESPFRHLRSNAIDVLAARREVGALGSLIKVAADRNSDVHVRTAVYKALGTLGGKDQLATVVQMLISNKDSSERDDLERALNSIAGRLGPDDADAVIFGLSGDTDARARLVGVLSRLGGSNALAMIRHESKQSDSNLRKAAIRAMASWGGPEPLEDLLTAAKTESDTSTRIIALRGYIQLASKPANRSAADTVKLLARGLAAAQRPDEKKAILAALPRVACDEAMKLAQSCAADKTLAGEVDLAVKKIKQTLAKKNLKATASRGNNDAGNALDGDAKSRWSTGRAMKPGDWFMIDLGVEDTVKKITLDTSASAKDFPIGYEVYTSFDSGKWGKPVLVGKGKGPITVLEFDKGVETRYIKIVQTGSSDSWHWSIHKLNIEF